MCKNFYHICPTAVYASCKNYILKLAASANMDNVTIITYILSSIAVIIFVIYILSSFYISKFILQYCLLQMIYICCLHT